MEEEGIDANLASQVDFLKKQFTFLSHQMSAIAAKLAAPPCPCATCKSVAPLAQHARPACLMPATALPAAQRMHASNEIKVENGVKAETAPSENGSTSADDDIKEVHPNGTPIINGSHGMPLTPVIAAALQGSTPTTAHLFAGWGAENNPHGGRKSKHCTPEMKIQVAEYAALHGAAHAARKFNIPPSVAAYYHRKLAKAKQIDATAAVIGATVLQKAEGADGQSPMLDLSVLAPSSESRQRGRPKMIGDKLDADLMEHMLQAKKDNPQLNLRPEVALEMARAFIASHSPMKLKENGGHIDLKMSWANKLVSRVFERENEIALGLPVGSLANGGLKHLTSGALMQDIFALAMAQETPFEDVNSTFTPLITNGKELSLDDFLGVGEKIIEDDEMPVAQIE